MLLQVLVVEQRVILNQHQREDIGQVLREEQVFGMDLLVSEQVEELQEVHRDKHLISLPIGKQQVMIVL